MLSKLADMSDLWDLTDDNRMMSRGRVERMIRSKSSIGRLSING